MISRALLKSPCTGGPSVAALFIETLLAKAGAATEGPPVHAWQILRYTPLALIVVIFPK